MVLCRRFTAENIEISSELSAKLIEQSSGIAIGVIRYFRVTMRLGLRSISVVRGVQATRLGQSDRSDVKMACTAKPQKQLVGANIRRGKLKIYKKACGASPCEPKPDVRGAKPSWNSPLSHISGSPIYGHHLLRVGGGFPEKFLDF